MQTNGKSVAGRSNMRQPKDAASLRIFFGEDDKYNRLPPL